MLVLLTLLRRLIVPLLPVGRTLVSTLIRRHTGRTVAGRGREGEGDSGREGWEREGDSGREGSGERG